ncbi:hypothetical protein F4803DRAFT_495037 [Xylaria telfairii]|nr:hypothetical protein F4803DRAFT_495037 [Xylaria telfairii]
MMEPARGRFMTTPKRRSCDRCHGQKLRCIREDNSDAAPCNRCLRQGAECVYSSSLPKGRPSMYKQTAQSSVLAGHVPTTAMRAMQNLRRNNPSVINNSNGGQTNANKSADTTVSAPTDLPTPAWGWLDSLDWDDSRINTAEFNWAQMITAPDTAEDPKGGVDTLFTDGYQNILDGFVPERGNGGDPTGHDGALKSADGPLTRNENRGGPSIDKNSHHDSIAELSQLSTILSPLHQSSLTLAERRLATGTLNSQETIVTSPFIDSPSFELVAEWLVHVSTNVNTSLPPGVGRRDSLGASPASEITEMGVILHKAFSATRELLETLRCLAVNAGPASHGTPSDLSANVPLQQSHAAPDTGQTSYFGAHAPGQYSNSVIRHLVIACHTMLLGTYVKLLTALQHDADRLSTTLSHPTASLPQDKSASTDLPSAALADMHLFIVVQLCSYLTERQSQAVDSYLSPQLTLGEPASPNPEADAMRALRMEVQHYLRRLQQTLGL